MKGQFAALTSGPGEDSWHWAGILGIGQICSLTIQSQIDLVGKEEEKGEEAPDGGKLGQVGDGG